MKSFYFLAGDVYDDENLQKRPQRAIDQTTIYGKHVLASRDPFEATISLRNDLHVSDSKNGGGYSCEIE